MSSVELEMRGLRDIPEAELDPLPGNIRVHCDRSDSRAVVYLLLKIFSSLSNTSWSGEFSSVSDSMGSMTFNLQLISGEYFIKINYEQSIRSTWHHVEIDSFTFESRMPADVSLGLDMDLTTDGWMRLSISGADEKAAVAITALVQRTFERVWPSGTTDPHIKDEVSGL